MTRIAIKIAIVYGPALLLYGWKPALMIWGCSMLAVFLDIK